MLRKNGIAVDLVDGYIEGWAGVEKKIKTKGYDIFGITCYTYSRVNALRVAEMAKKAAPSSLVVIGGAHSSLMHRQVLENYPAIDVAVIGEGEETFLEICKGMPLEGILGIAYRSGGKVSVNNKRDLIANLDDIPFPAWDMIDIKKYPPDGSGIYNGIDLSIEPCVPVMFSRGCVGECTFCSDKKIWKRWRRRSAKNMADELELLHKKYGAKRLAFNDDMFTADRRATLELCGEITKRGIKIVFEVVTRADYIDREMLSALKGAGCYKACFGIETASPELLKRMKKPIDIKTSEEAIRMTREAGIRTQALLIVGSVGETKDSINKTIDFLNRAKPDDIGLANGLRILPGTDLYDHAKKVGFIDDDFWLSDFNWKIFTAENSKTRLNIFCEAVMKREPLSSSELANFFKYFKHYVKGAEYSIKSLAERTGLRKKKKRPGKYAVAYS